MRKRPQARLTPITLAPAVLVVVLLLAFAVPTFAGARDRAENRAVQADLTNALKVQLSQYLATGAFTTDQEVLTAEARGIAWSVWPTRSWDASTCRQRICVLLGTLPGDSSGPGGNLGRDPGTVCLLSQAGTGEFFKIIAVTQPTETIRYVRGGSEAVSRIACDSTSIAAGSPSAW
jgi:type II secretory pathway pseudopilin PulG